MTDRKIALVTGASYGIGQACAVGLARDGFDVAITELRTDSLADTERRIAAEGRRSFAVALDVRSQESVEQAMDWGTSCAQCGTSSIPHRASALSPLTRLVSAKAKFSLRGEENQRNENAKAVAHSFCYASSDEFWQA